MLPGVSNHNSLKIQHTDVCLSGENCRPPTTCMELTRLSTEDCLAQSGCLAWLVLDPHRTALLLTLVTASTTRFHIACGITMTSIPSPLTFALLRALVISPCIWLGAWLPVFRDGSPSRLTLLRRISQRNPLSQLPLSRVMWWQKHLLHLPNLMKA